VLAKPQTDLCQKCQVYIGKASNGGNMDETEIKFPFKRNGLPCFENAKTFPLQGAQRTASVCEL